MLFTVYTVAAMLFTVHTVAAMLFTICTGRVTDGGGPGIYTEILLTVFDLCTSIDILIHNYHAHTWTRFFFMVPK
jgi:hypothetical protein